MPTGAEVARWLRRAADSRNDQAFQRAGWLDAADAVEQEFGGSELLGTYEGVPVVVERPDGRTDKEWAEWKKRFVGRLTVVAGEVRQPLDDDILDEFGF